MKLRVNWYDAEKDYVSNASLSYQDIADKYGVSKKQVGIRAKQSAWTMRRQEVHEKGMDEFFANQKGHIAQTNKDHAKLYRKLRQLYALQIDTYIQRPELFDVKDVRQTVQGLQMVVEMERKILRLDAPENEPKDYDRMSLSELFALADEYPDEAQV